MNQEEEFENYSRKKYSLIILPRFQLKIISLALMSSIGTIIVAGGAFHYLVERQFDRLLEKVLISPEAKTEFLSSMSMSVLYLIILCVAFGLLMLGFSVVYSHKIAGPIYHISKVLEKFVKGDARTRVNLRRGDEFFFLGDQVNQVLEWASKETVERKRKI